MKVIVYQNQKKITVGNISIPTFEELKEKLEDADIYTMQITATRGLAPFQLHNQTLQKEIDEGINWQQVTVN